MSDSATLPPTVRDFEAIPAELRALSQWIAWTYEPATKPGGKPRKVPMSHRGGKAKVNDPSTWGTFEEALAAATLRGFSGIGFVFTETDPYCGIDLDGVVEDGALRPDALARIRALNTYAEFSPSGAGVHLLARARLAGKGKNRPGVGECYDRARYFCCTGNRVPDAPASIEERQAEVSAFYDELCGRAAPPRALPEGLDGPGPDDCRVARARAYVEKMPPAIEGSGGHNQTFAVACALFRFGVSESDALALLRDYSARCLPPWSERELLHKIEDARKAVIAEGKFGALLDGAAPARTAPVLDDDGASDAERGGVAFRLVGVRRTPQRTSLRIALKVDGENFGEVSTTSTASGEEDLVSAVLDAIEAKRERRPPREAAAGWRSFVRQHLLCSRVVAAAEARLARRAAAAAPSSERPDMATAAGAFMRARLDLRFLGMDGSERAAWSEALGAFITRGRFAAEAGPDLVRHLVGHARDFPAPSPESPTCALTAAERALRFAWPIATKGLPDEAGAGLGAESKAARRARALVVECFQRNDVSLRYSPQSADDFRGIVEGPIRSVSTSLAGLARGAQREEAGAAKYATEHDAPAPRFVWGRWRRLAPGFDAFAFVSEGRVSLALRPELLRGQMRGLRLDLADDHACETLERYGLVAEQITVDETVDGGRSRLRAYRLADAVVEEILGEAY